MRIAACRFTNRANITMDAAKILSNSNCFAQAEDNITQAFSKFQTMNISLLPELEGTVYSDFQDWVDRADFLVKDTYHRTAGVAEVLGELGEGSSVIEGNSLSVMEAFGEFWDRNPFREKEDRNL